MFEQENDNGYIKTFYIEKISKFSKDRYGETLLRFLDEYNLNSLMSATISQLKEFSEKLERELNQKNNNDSKVKKEELFFE